MTIKELISASIIAGVASVPLFVIRSASYNEGYIAAEKKHENDRIELRVVSSNKSGDYKDHIELNSVIGDKKVELACLEDFLNEFNPRKIQEIGLNECGISSKAQKGLIKSVESGQRQLYGETTQGLNKPIPDFNANVELRDMSDGYGPCYVTEIKLAPKR